MNTEDQFIVPGFKAMEWVKKIRENIYKMEKENPKLHAKRMESIRKKMDRNVPLLDIISDGKM